MIDYHKSKNLKPARSRAEAGRRFIMELKENQKELVKTRKGYPALWEEGGGSTNTGGAQIICNVDGNPKTAVYVRRGGHLSCGNHALFIVRESDVFVLAGHHRGDFSIEVLQIKKIFSNEGEYFAEVETLAEYENGEWDNENVAKKYKSAIDAAVEKAQCYHCREMHFGLEKEVKIK